MNDRRVPKACERFGYSDLKESALSKELRMGFVSLDRASEARVQCQDGSVCSAVMVMMRSGAAFELRAVLADSGSSERSVHRANVGVNRGRSLVAPLQLLKHDLV